MVGSSISATVGDAVTAGRGQNLPTRVERRTLTVRVNLYPKRFILPTHTHASQQTSPKKNAPRPRAGHAVGGPTQGGQRLKRSPPLIQVSSKPLGSCTHSAVLFFLPREKMLFFLAGTSPSTASSAWPRLSGGATICLIASVHCVYSALVPHRIE